ncbi:hypothetical protein JQ616_37065 [Bradyrhizobium tropiciagri]|uniref:hypothetical protein n=1 Tax=Bradyrhizobium tropiciagri TaxID=312253 RepID=UPI001BA916E0|nr:hypothetical protein [Bradyrhizobium tropiciagri]MBR0900597.1 hypothetical protein [Bradyrhizobium tropiciagri]
MTPDQSRYALVLEIPRRLVAPSLKCLILEQGVGGDEAESSASALGVSHPAHADPVAVAVRRAFDRKRNARWLKEMVVVAERKRRYRRMVRRYADVLPLRKVAIACAAGMHLPSTS